MELVEKQHKNVNLSDQNSLENTENNNKIKIHWETVQKRPAQGHFFGKLGLFSAWKKYQMTPFMKSQPIAPKIECELASMRSCFKYSDLNGPSPSI